MVVCRPLSLPCAAIFAVRRLFAGRQSFLCRATAHGKEAMHGSALYISFTLDHVFPSSACESLDRNHTDRVFPSSACEPLDQKHTDRVFRSSSCEPFDRKHTDRVFL